MPPEPRLPPAGAVAARLALRNLRRDWRAGELRLVVAALVVAIAAVSAVGFFTDRVRRALVAEAGVLLGGDLAVESSAPIAGEIVAAARTAGLAPAQTVAFRSVVTAGERLELAEVKAVDPRYPLRGQLSVAPQPFAAPRPAAHGPPPGQVWVEARLLHALDIEVGERLGLGASTPRVGAVLAFEPDRGGDLFNIAPRVLMAHADLAATELIGPGSRVTYRLLAAGDRAGVAAFRAAVSGRLGPNTRLRNVRDARPEIDAALARAEHFLSLAALVAVIVAGIAIGTAAGRYALRHYDAVAIMRAFGATQVTVLAAFALELALLGLAAGTLGAAVGFAAQFGLAVILSDLAGAGLPAPGPGTAVSAVLTGPIALLGFALPPLARLRDVPPARVLRRDLEPVRGRGLLVYAGPVLAIVALAPWRIQEAALTGWIMAASLAGVVLLAAAANLLVHAAGSLRRRVGVAWRFGLANLGRRGRASVLQAVALGLGITVMLLLTVVRGDLLAGWRASLPPGAPNHFLINIQPDEVEALRRWFAERELGAPALYPMIRGRLTHVNGTAVAPQDYPDPRAQRLTEREFNLSWARTPAADNRIVAGRWWSSPPDTPGQFSVETGIAETLGLALGDELTYSVAGQSVRGRITSLRRVNWDSFNVNFFVVAAPGLVDGLPATWITAMHLTPEASTELVSLVRRFPSVTVIDVDALLGHVRRIMDRVSLAVEYVFGFTLLAGLMVLYAALQASHDERVREAAILRSLGARDPQIRAGLLAELLALGLVCGTIAALTASVAGWVLATQVFDVPFRPSPWLWPAGMAAGALGVPALGWLGVRHVLAAPAGAILRRA